MGFRNWPPILPKERHEDHAEPGGGSSQRRYYAERPDNPMSMRTAVRLPKDFVFREEARQSRDTRYPHRSEQHDPERPAHVFLQTAHLAHILLAAHAVDHRT